MIRVAIFALLNVAKIISPNSQVFSVKPSLTLVFGSTAYCRESDEFSTPGKQPFYLARTAKKAKKSARTEAARAERIKRRLFSEEGDENDQSPLVLDPPVFENETNKHSNPR